MVRGRTSTPRSRRRRPRTRGDGPSGSPPGRRQATSTPHPRGWSGAGDEALLDVPVDPAPAGMVLHVAATSWRPWCRPRTRGDGPVYRPLQAMVRRSTPHPRGWSLAGVLAVGVPAVDPAPAGMVRRGAPSDHLQVGRPRTRGDGPRPSADRSTAAWSTPHPRGWSDPSGRLRGLLPVDPAPAGMVPRGARRAVGPGGRPRTRGDGPEVRNGRRTDRASTPHPRGWSVGQLGPAGGGRVDPAPAGMVRAAPDGAACAGGRPRTRGDGPPHVARWHSSRPSTPHPRGWSGRSATAHHRPRVDPAPAGMVRRWRRSRPSRRRRPRTRGDGPSMAQVQAVTQASTPHRVDPAPAGMVRRWRRSRPSRRRRPRTRGDGPDKGALAREVRMSTPHPRGWSPALCTAHSPSWVDPAPAGMVRLRPRAGSRWACRPRTRGDGPAPGARPSCWRRSTPHPRGWSQPGRRRRPPTGVDPAPAGMVRHPGCSPARSSGRPRTRGDGPRHAGDAPGVPLSTPHPRGWSARGQVVLDEITVDPAPAGMVPRWRPW